jgi:hypothetical protein
LLVTSKILLGKVVFGLMVYLMENNLTLVYGTMVYLMEIGEIELIYNT